MGLGDWVVGGQLLLHFSVVRGKGTFLGRTHTRFILFSSLRSRMSVVVLLSFVCLCFGGGMLLWWFSCIARVEGREWVAYIY